MENVWLGVTAENQKTADERIPILLDIPAAVRFISVEPMLSPVDINPGQYPWVDILPDSSLSDRQYIDWVICGCESGLKRRKTEIDWIASLKDQCLKHNIPFFLKQREIAGKVVNMPELDGKIWNQLPR